jgi:hypothetical protein
MFECEVEGAHLSGAPYGTLHLELASSLTQKRWTCMKNTIVTNTLAYLVKASGIISL